MSRKWGVWWVVFVCVCCLGRWGEDGCAGLWWLVGRLVAIWRLVRSSATGAVEESLLTTEKKILIVWL